MSSSGRLADCLLTDPGVEWGIMDGIDHQAHHCSETSAIKQEKCDLLLAVMSTPAEGTVIAETPGDVLRQLRYLAARCFRGSMGG